MLTPKQYCQYYSSGVPLKDIIADGGNATMLYRAIDEAGIPRRNRNQFEIARGLVSGSRPFIRIPRPANTAAKARAEEFLVQYQSGKTLEEIATNCVPVISRERVRQLMRKHTNYRSRGRGERVKPPTELQIAAHSDWMAGAHIDTITEKYGITRNQMTTIHGKIGGGRRSYRPMAARNKLVIWQYYNSPHLTLADIAKMYGLGNPEGVSATITRNGLLPNRHGSYELAAPKKRAIVAELEKGRKDYPQIAKDIGSSYVYVMNIKKQLEQASV